MDPAVHPKCISANSGLPSYMAELADLADLARFARNSRTRRIGLFDTVITLSERYLIRSILFIFSYQIRLLIIAYTGRGDAYVVCMLIGWDESGPCLHLPVR